MTPSSSRIVTVFCNELCKTNECNTTELNLLNRSINGLEANTTVGYDKFVYDPGSLPPRILDLLQLAAFIFCADRSISRGRRDSLDNESWARTFDFHIPVQDYEFWSNQDLQLALSTCLEFMTGDRKYSFIFERSSISPIESRRQISFFSNNAFVNEDMSTVDVMLLSGGLDSLAGAIERLNEHRNRGLLVVNHRSSTSAIKTQNTIVKDLQARYENRLRPYGFTCHNKTGIGRVEESQRSRMFLFSSIAYAICEYYNKHNLYIYENGITSINLPTQGDIMNARASRTTHPKTIGLLKRFFRFFDKKFEIVTPFCTKTKEDIIRLFSKYDEKDLISSSISCSKTRMHSGDIEHCGCCSQCIDRRFGMFAAGLDEYDAGYTHNFIYAIPDNETKQRLYYTLRLSCVDIGNNEVDLFEKFPAEVNDVIKYWHCDNPADSLAEVSDLFFRYADSVLRAATLMRSKFDDLRIPNRDNSLMKMLELKDYLKTPIFNRANEIDSILKKSIPLEFRTCRPKNEGDFSDRVRAMLSAAGNNFTREYPVLKFGITQYRSDLGCDDLLIESKYIRKKTTPSVATEGIAADITKISVDTPVMFIVYDPERTIFDDDEFTSSYENVRKNCFVRVYR